MKGHLSRDQYRLYQLIWERFVASQMANAEYDTVSVDIMAGDEATAPAQRPYLFRAAGSTLRFAGFLALYEETEPADRPDDGENQVPIDLTEAERLDLLQLLPEQHFTQPPPRYSEATLVKAMEEHGIGRPSTYASIVSTIQKRGYVEMESRGCTRRRSASMSTTCWSTTSPMCSRSTLRRGWKTSWTGLPTASRGCRSWRIFIAFQ